VCKCSIYIDIENIEKIKNIEKWDIFSIVENVTRFSNPGSAEKSPGKQSVHVISSKTAILYTRRYDTNMAANLRVCNTASEVYNAQSIKHS